MNSKIQFVLSKIKRYGFFGVWKYIYIKYSAGFLYKTGLCKYVKIHHRDYKIYFSKTNVAYWLYLQRTLHDGDVNDILSKLNPGDTFIDIGANIGTVTIPVAKYLGNTSKVYSIEAHPNTYVELRKNILINNLKNVQTLQVAVGDKTGLTYFTDIRHDDMNKVSKDTQGIAVPMMRLDDICKDIEHIAMLKIDVEGYEKFLLEHATETLKKTKSLYVEYLDEATNSFGYKRDEIKKLLEQHGFECELAGKAGHYNKDIDNLMCVNKSFL